MFICLILFTLQMHFFLFLPVKFITFKFVTINNLFFLLFYVTAVINITKYIENKCEKYRNPLMCLKIAV